MGVDLTHDMVTHPLEPHCWGSVLSVSGVRNIAGKICSQYILKMDNLVLILKIYIQTILTFFNLFIILISIIKNYSKSSYKVMRLTGFMEADYK